MKGGRAGQAVHHARRAVRRRSGADGGGRRAVQGHVVIRDVILLLKQAQPAHQVAEPQLRREVCARSMRTCVSVGTDVASSTQHVRRRTRRDAHNNASCPRSSPASPVSARAPSEIKRGVARAQRGLGAPTARTWSLRATFTVCGCSSFSSSPDKLVSTCARARASTAAHHCRAHARAAEAREAAYLRAGRPITHGALRAARPERTHVASRKKCAVKVCCTASMSSSAITLARMRTSSGDFGVRRCAVGGTTILTRRAAASSERALLPSGKTSASGARLRGCGIRGSSTRAPTGGGMARRAQSRCEQAVSRSQRERKGRGVWRKVDRGRSRPTLPEHDCSTGLE